MTTKWSTRGRILSMRYLSANSQMKIHEQLMEGILAQVLEDMKRIVLNSTLTYATIIEGI